MLLAAIGLMLSGCAGPGAVPDGVQSTTDAGVTATAPAETTPDSPAPDITAPSLKAMEAMLSAELARLGKSAMAAGDYLPPSGAMNIPFDLHALLIDPDGEGGLDPQGVQLSWTERLVGDYNMDGLVNASDLTPLGQYYNETVDYYSGSPWGTAWWPTGSPISPAADNDLSNWRRARIDGNGDGLINLSDITSIAQHWQEQLGGYRFFMRRSAGSAWEQVMDPRDMAQVLEIPIGWSPVIEGASYYDQFVNVYRVNLPVSIDAEDEIRVVPVNDDGDHGESVAVVCRRKIASWHTAPTLITQRSDVPSYTGMRLQHLGEIQGVQISFREWLPGDADISGIVGQLDMECIRKYFALEVNSYSGDDRDFVERADANGDGWVTPMDLNVIGQTYGNRLDGYAVEFTDPHGHLPELIMSPAAPAMPFVIPRPVEIEFKHIPTYDVLIPISVEVDQLTLRPVMLAGVVGYSGSCGEIYVREIREMSAPVDSTEPLIAILSTRSLDNGPFDEIELNGEHSYSQVGEIILYEWDLDDDGTYEATGIEQTVTPAAIGEYTFRLRVTDDQGNSAEVELTVVVV